jgi:predicted ATPase
VIGREFSFELLSALVSMSEDELTDALGKLVAADLVFQRGSPPDATYVFKHALVQDAAYESLLRSRRQILHARIAEALEDRFQDVARAQPELVAHHWASAGLPDRAVTHWTMAGQQALARSATTEAIAHFRAALSDLAKLPESAERDRRELAVQRAAGSAMAAYGFAAPETGRAYERALELTERIGDLGELFPVLYGLCLYHLYGAELQAARAEARRLIEPATDADDAGLRFFAHRAAGVSAYPAGDLAGARAHLEEALALYRPAEHRAPASVYAFDTHVVCLDYLARTLLPLGEVADAVRLSEEAVAEARRLGHRNSLCLPLFYGGTLRQQLSDGPAVAALEAELAAIAGEERFPIWAAGAKVLRGWGQVAAGEPGVGGRTIEEGISDWQATGARLMLPYFEALLAEAKVQEGRSGEAAALLRGALKRATATGERWFAAELHRRLGELLRAQGDLPRARAELEAAVEVARAQGAVLWQLRAAVSLSECLAEGGDGAEAARLLEPLLSRSGGCRALPEFARANLLLGRIAGMAVHDVRAPTH